MSKRIFVFAGICLVIFCGLVRVQDFEHKEFVEGVLSVLNKEERKDLQSLFARFFFFDQFSYPLFGSKPMSLGRLLPKDEYKRGWQAWKKIAPAFESRKFVIRESRFNGQEIVLVANLEAVEAVYNQNRDLFEARVSLDKLMDALKGDDLLFQELVNNEVYLGILLGYGRKNAALFASGRKDLQPFSNGHPIWYYFSPAMPVYFACDLNTEETKELKLRYDSERAAILRRAKSEGLFTSMLVALKETR